MPSSRKKGARDRSGKAGNAPVRRQSERAPAQAGGELEGAGPVAFVIMPFDLLSDQVFDVLIRPALESRGYRARRADTTSNLRLIMRDIIEGLQQADLVVADLSGRNANVFWELGLAHGLRKRVILLARSAGDIPFDLGGYRAIIYQLDIRAPIAFDESLLVELTSRLDDVATGGVRFGDPLADFGISLGPAAETADLAGLLDDAIAAQQEAPEVGAKIAQMGDLLRQLGRDMEAAAGNLPPEEPGGELVRAQQIFAAYAPVWDQYATRFEDYIEEVLKPMTQSALRGLPAFLKLGDLHGRDDDGQREAMLASMSELAAAASEYPATFLDMARVIRQCATLTGRLRQPGERLAVAMERIAAQFEELAAIEGKMRAV